VAPVKSENDVATTKAQNIAQVVVLRVIERYLATFRKVGRDEKALGCEIVDCHGGGLARREGCGKTSLV
jgi:hypothetical protein